MSTPNLGLVLPVDHGSADTWDVILDTVFNVIDAHDHQAGRGLRITPAAMNINADLSFAGTHAVTNALALDMTPTVASAVSGYSSALFVDNSNNLYFRNSGGTNIQVTAGNNLNFSATGSWGGDYSAAAALADYISANNTFHFYQPIGSAVRQYGRMAHSDVDLFEFKATPTAGVPTNRVRLKSPAALAGSYDLTWLAALPAANTLMMVDNTGQITSPATPTLPANANIALQGTGYVKTGSRTLTIPVPTSGSCIQQGGTISTASGGGAKPGCAFAVSTTALIPIPLIDGDGQRALVSAVTLHGTWTGTGNITTQLFDYIYAADTLASAGSSTGSAINSAIAVNITTPFNVGAGDVIYLSVATAGTNSGKAVSIEVTYSIP